MATLKHPSYPLVTYDQAEAIALSFEGPDKEAVEYPFTFPELKPNEVRIKETYLGICHSDICLYKREWFETPYPCVPGHEIVGKIIAKGSEVNEFQIGDTVGVGYMKDSCGKCYNCKSGIEQSCRETPFHQKFVPVPNFGGCATHYQGPSHWCFPVPKSIPEHVAGPLFCAGATVYAPITRYAKPGQNVGIIGIGGLGHLAIMFASRMGMKVTAISTSRNKEQEARSYGATDFLVTSDQEQVKQYAERFDFILNTVSSCNSQQLALYLSLLAKEGTIAVVGLPDKSVQLEIDFFILVTEQKNIVGSAMASRQEYYEMLQFAAKHKVYPVCEVFDWNDFSKGIKHMESGKAKYRVVIKIKDFPK